VQLLLEQIDINPSLADKEGRTPLLWAAKESQKVAQLLLERSDINPNLANEDSRTPLLWAIENKSHELV